MGVVAVCDSLRIAQDIVELVIDDARSVIQHDARRFGDIDGGVPVCRGWRRQAKACGAFFVAVPPVAWALITISLVIAAFAGRRTDRNALH
jgi:hypothetical protein